MEDPSIESSDALNFQEEEPVLDETVNPQMSSVEQLSTQLQGLQNLRQKEKKEFSMLIAQQEERLRAEFKLQLQHAEFEMDGLKGLLKLKDAEMEENHRKAELTMNKDFSTPISGNPSLNFRPSLSTVNENSLCQLLELSRQQYQSHIDSMHLPPVDIIKFDGEPLKYWQFIRLFSSVLIKRQCQIKRNSLDCISTLLAKLEMLSHIVCTTPTLDWAMRKPWLF